MIRFSVPVAARTLLILLALMALPAGPALATGPAELLERGAFLERVRGETAAAEQAYRDAIEAFPRGDRELAEALFRLGALLVRGGRAAEAVADERAPLRRLFDEFPARRELLARADRLLIARSAPPPEAPELAPGRPARARVLAVREDTRLVAVGLGSEDGVDVGTPLVIYRGGKAIGEALAVRVAPRVAAAKLMGGEALATTVTATGIAVGDEADLRWPPAAPRPRESGAGSPAPLADAARSLLAATFEPDDAALVEARPGATFVEVRVFTADAAFIRSLPFSFERLAPAGAESDALLAAAVGPLARLRPHDERHVIDRTRATGLVGVRRLGLEPGRRASIAFGEKRGGGAGTERDLRIALTLARGGAPGEIALDLEAIALDRPAEPLAYPGANGPIGLAVPRFQRIGGRIALDGARPAALLGGLRDPAGGPARDALILLSLRSGPGERE